MAAIVKELSIEAAPQRVWGALTQQDEIVQWWANEARVKPEVGSLGEFRFGHGCSNKRHCQAFNLAVFAGHQSSA